MALENCKECQAKISTAAKTCPACGAPVKRTSTATKLVAALIAAGLFASIAQSCSSKNELESAAKLESARVAALTPEQRISEAKAVAEIAAKKAARDEEINAAYACKSFIEKNLKDPDSAKFEYSGPAAPSTKNKKGIFEVQHKVRAKNSFGALTPSYFNCQLLKTKDNKSWILVSLKEVK